MTMQRTKIGDKEFEVLIENDQINKRIRMLALQLELDYEERCPIFLGVLNGSFIFIADLLKEISLPCEVGFVKLVSYSGTESTGQVKDILGLPEGLENRDVIIVEDIVDTGTTLKYLLEKVSEMRPSSLTVCTLLLKPDAVKVALPGLTYVGFEISDEFVVGYGLDYEQQGRNLKDIYRIKSIDLM